MSLNRIDLSGNLCVIDGCSKLIFNDTTGSIAAPCIADQNINGYGLTGGITVNAVRGFVLNVYFPNLPAYKFTFTVVSGTITVATLTDINLVTTNIFPNLVSTIFPLVDFNVILSAYGVTMPSLSDGNYTWDYTITGVASSGELFSYTTSGGVLCDCSTNCCIGNSYLDIDPCCDCTEDKIKNIMYSEIFLNAARYAMNIGQDSKAASFLVKSKEYCDSNCKTC